MACPTSARAALRASIRPLQTVAASPSTSTSSSLYRRHYHSYDHPPPPGPFGATESAILAAAYKHVPEHGFTQTALTHGARDAGLPDISPSVLTNGPFTLIKYHLITQRQALAERSRQLFERDDAPAGVGGKVAALTWERLLANKDIIHRWQEALAVMAQPSYVPESIKELAALSDEIWFLAGDTAVDPSWYTKRATLSMVYTTTELFMTNDHSPDYVETGKFLTRRLDEVKSVGGALGNIGQWVGFTANAGINILRSKGVRI
ncbi:unnamed protein product [Clonostachys rosea]|uniref:Ubiquinone biosynthesis protein n=1 Tax=Bionectria ochroleuca TaxID=29856 RepID=A0ABY6U045_BIOOC|nr:unnamed protein product [Clonostachys rosea]